MNSWFDPRRETPADDEARTRRLLDAAADAFDTELIPDRDAEVTDFECIVLEGLLTDVQVAVYPPVGHTYPKRENEETAR
ncbi:hypothetical protein ACFT25_38065 [Streptomyces hydrogenans]|uniref:hypothetical protein n=1 Tax=Streptomyces hydrogenans TaxID=1873719 RepID=UPI00362566DE